MSRILIIEDEEAIADLEKDYLELSSFEVEIETDGQQGLEKALKNDFDMIILDIMLPGVDGFEICKQIREAKEIPILMVSARKEDIDKIRGLGLGADDYITKPFSLSVLRARVNTQLRKAAAMSEKEKDNEHVYRKELYVFDFDRMKFMVDGKETELSKTEQKLLRILVENAGMNMRRELLLDRVWSDGAEYVDENALSVSIKRLRDKLGAEHAIRTVYGIGYRWE